MLQLDAVGLTGTGTGGVVVGPTLIRDQQVVTAVLFEVQLVVAVDLSHFSGVAVTVLIQPRQLSHTVLGEVGAVVTAVLIDLGALAVAELATGLVALPITGQDLVTDTVGIDLQHMILATLVGKADVTGA
ncbi:hypothetical protein D3C84_487170 [compost metagenome]